MNEQQRRKAAFLKHHISRTPLDDYGVMHYLPHGKYVTPCGKDYFFLFRFGRIANYCTGCAPVAEEATP